MKVMTVQEVLEDIKAEIEQVKAIMNEEIIEHNRKDLINFVNGINQCLCIIDKHISGKEQQMTEQERKNYCKDCDRSIWGDKSCDINVDDNGYYNRPDICLCKIVNGKRAELHSWEKDKYISGKEK